MPDETGTEKSGMDLYFIDRAGQNFKVAILHSPYFLIDCKDEKHLMELGQHLQKKFEGCRIEFVDMEDLDMPNHLSGKKHKFLKIIFHTVNDLIDAKNVLR